MKVLLTTLALGMASSLFAGEIFIVEATQYGAYEESSESLLHLATTKAYEQSRTLNKCAEVFNQTEKHQLMSQNVLRMNSGYWGEYGGKVAKVKISFKCLGDEGPYTVEAYGQGSAIGDAWLAQERAVAEAALACGTQVRRVSEWRFWERYYGLIHAKAKFECL